jgi:hypothetical protein
VSRRGIACLIAVILLGATSCDRAPAPEPPVNLDGTYTAIVPRTGFEGADRKEYLPSIFGGRWELVIDGTTYLIEGDNFNRVSGRIVTTPDLIRFEDIPAPRGAFNCFDDEGNRVLSRSKGTGIYTYELAEGILTLRGSDEPCELRGLIMERGWERSS